MEYHLANFIEMRNKLFILLSVILLNSGLLTGQGQYNNWYFGWHKSITFNTGVPTVTTNSGMYNSEPCASISDAAGNILFYTNSYAIWDSTNNLMPNGNGLSGNGDTQQSVLIVPLPGNNNIYYVFNIGDTNNLNQHYFSYSTIDMTLNSGQGDVVVKNNYIQSSDVYAEKLTATKHNNGIDYWIVVRNIVSNQFESYLLSANGLNLSPIISNVGLPTSDHVGAIKISNNGCWLISTNRVYQGGTLELFSFNNTTGQIYNGANMQLGFPYGLEFSPQSTKFYIGHNGLSPIHQFDLLAGSSTQILNSIIAASDSMPYTFGFQLGPDNKIYFIGPWDSTLGVINYPDSLGLSCHIDTATINIGPLNNGTGLPNNFNLLYQGNLSCSITTINEPTTFEIKFYPNPFMDNLNIETNTSCEYIINIYDNLSQLIIQESFTDLLRLNTTRLETGMYFYRITCFNKTVSIGKLMK